MTYLLDTVDRAGETMEPATLPGVGDLHDAVEQALLALLRRYPDALVGAISGESAVRLSHLPASIPLDRAYPTVEGRSLAGLVSAEDLTGVTRAWSRARENGVGAAAVELLLDRKMRGMVAVFDLTSRHGVMAIVFAEGAGVDSPEVTELAGMTELASAIRYSRVTKNPGAVITGVDPAFEQMLGYSSDEVVGRRALELVHPDDHQVGIDSWMRMLDFPGASRTVRLRHRHRDGRWVWVEVTNHNRLLDPAHGDIVSEMLDISEEVAAQEAARARQQLLEQVTATVPVGLLHANVEGRLLYTNDRLTEITGLTAGMSMTDWRSLCAGSAEAVRASLDAAIAGSPANIVAEAVDATGGMRHCSLSIRPLYDTKGAVTGVTGSIEDVTDSVTERQRLELRAATDSLTGCLNRSAMLATIQDALDGLSEDGPADGVAVIFVDVDGLKELNDRLGHLAGDALLVEVGRRLRASVRARDSVGRYGGDEFLILARHVGSTEHAMTVARWVASRTLENVMVEGALVQIRVSLGVAWTSDPAVTASWLVRRSDAAMYRSKREGLCQPVMA